MIRTVVWTLGLGATLIADDFRFLAVIALLSLVYHLLGSGKIQVEKAPLRSLALSLSGGGFLIMSAAILLTGTGVLGAGSPGAAVLLVVGRVAIAASWTMGWVAQLDTIALRRRLHSVVWFQPVAELVDTVLFHGSILANQWTERYQAAAVRGAEWKSPTAVWTMGRILGQGALVALDQSVRREETRALRGACSPAQIAEVTETKKALELRELTLGYGPGCTVLEQISFEARQGEWLIVAGASGSGKSTLLRGIAGLLPVVSGELRRFGGVIDGSAPQVDGRIALVFQNPDHQFLGSTPRDDLLWGLRQRGIKNEAAHQRIDRLFERLHIAELADKPLHQLSLGQRRLVALSGALSIEPKVLLCDELTNGLDPVNAHRVLNAVELARSQGTTVLWVTHELHRIPAAARRLLLLRDGALIFDGPLASGLARETLDRARLWVAPQTHFNSDHQLD